MRRHYYAICKTVKGEFFVSEPRNRADAYLQRERLKVSPGAFIGAVAGPTILPRETILKSLIENNWGGESSVITKGVDNDEVPEM